MSYTRECQQCGEPMPASWAGGPRWGAKFCSNACKQAAYRRRVADAQKARNAKKKTSRKKAARKKPVPKRASRRKRTS